MPNRRTAFFISDRTGITVEMLGNSLLTQFDVVEFRRITLPFIDNIDKAQEALNQIKAAHVESGMRPLVFTSLMDDALREEIAKADAMVLDMFERFIWLSASCALSILSIKGRVMRRNSTTSN